MHVPWLRLIVRVSESLDEVGEVITRENSVYCVPIPLIRAGASEAVRVAVGTSVLVEKAVAELFLVRVLGAVHLLEISPSSRAAALLGNAVAEAVDARELFCRLSASQDCHVVVPLIVKVVGISELLAW